MSQFSSDFSATAGPAMLSYQGDTVTRYADGSGTGLSVTAIIDDLNDGGMEMPGEAGVLRIREKRLRVAASQSVTLRDHWLVSGDRWATVGVTDAHDGLKMVTIRITERTKSEKTRGRG